MKDERPETSGAGERAAPGRRESPGSPADAGAPEKRRLTRGRDGKVLAGVCEGAGRYFDVDPVIFRVVLAVLSLTGGIGLIVYGMGWLVIPQEGERQSEAQRLLSGRIEGAPLTAVLMALVGCGLYASTLGNGTNQAFSLLLLASTAGAVYWSQQRRRTRAAGEVPATAASAVVDAPPAVQAPPEPGASPSWWREPLAKGAPTYLWGPDDGVYGDADRKAWKRRKTAARRERSWLFGLTVFLLAVLAAAIGTGASWRFRPFGSSLEIGLAAALGVFGTAYVLASFAGRARGGTLFFTLLTIAALIGAVWVPKTGQGVRRATWRPATAAAVQKSYERGAGGGTLDLTALALNGATVTTRLDIGAGQAEVRLPRDATVRLDLDLDIGEVVVPGKVNDGVDVHENQHRRLAYGPPPGTLSSGTIVVQVHVGVGQLRVIR